MKQVTATAGLGRGIGSRLVFGWYSGWGLRQGYGWGQDEVKKSREGNCCKMKCRTLLS